MTPFIQLLLSAGPTVLRALGSMAGEDTARPANAIANVIESVRGLPANVAGQRVSEALAALPPDQLVQLQSLEVRLAEVARDREANRLAAETAQHSAAQETARIEGQSSDEYVRRTRPMLARRGALAALVYGLTSGIVFPLLEAFTGTGPLPDPDPWIISALFAPTAAYIGARTVDAFSRAGKT